MINGKEGSDEIIESIKSSFVLFNVKLDTLHARRTSVTPIWKWRAVSVRHGQIGGRQARVCGGANANAVVRDLTEKLREEEGDASFQNLLEEATELLAFVNDDPTAELQPPRITERQRNRMNIPHSSPQDYFRRVIWFRFQDAVIQEFNTRFSESSTSAFKISYL